MFSVGFRHQVNGLPYVWLNEVPMDVIEGFQQLDIPVFFKKYWQKQPLLIKNSKILPQQLISPEELAGLACEEGVEGRLILERGGRHPWELRHGPFQESDFTSLPQDSWTLLVQGVEQWVPEVYRLLETFRFLPNWRIDDVMVSFSPRLGSVGPHLDNYDVFLLQGLGRREWRIGRTASHEENLIPDLDLKILKEFTDFETLVVEEGDILYLPPRFGHHGISLENSLTYSVGFRAPSNKELVGHFSDHILIHGQQDCLFEDPQRRSQQSSGELLCEDLDRLYDEVIRTFHQKDLFKHFIGSYLTLPKYQLSPDATSIDPFEVWEPDTEVEVFLGARLVYVVEKERILWFINGKLQLCDPKSLALVRRISDGSPQFYWQELLKTCQCPEDKLLIRQLVAAGWLVSSAEAAL